MKFIEYCDIMQTRGIGYLNFVYRGQEYCIAMSMSNFMEYVKYDDVMPCFDYVVSYDIECEAWYDSFENLLQSDVFDGNTLEEIWTEIENVTFDELSEEGFLLEDDGLTLLEAIEKNKQAYLQRDGIEQWSHSLSAAQSFGRIFPYLILCSLVLPVFSLFYLFLDRGWFAVAFFSGISVIALIGSCIRFAVKPTIIKYLITDKKIETSGDYTHKTTYQNIKKVTMRKYRNKSGCGVIQIHVRKGWSPNFRLVHVPDVENVYKLIMDNIANAGSGK
ncbi:MAG: hypothetical protein K2M64_03890 [Clostridia bacterium]|nr:hypothetical protein [Clostridia bacterium]